MTFGCHALRLPLKIPYAWARGVQHHRDVVLVEDGGWGEVATPPHEPPVDPARVAGFRGHADAAPARIRCGLVGARLDAAAREQGMSLASLLAARVSLPSGPVECNALVPVLPPDATVAATRAAVAAGYSCVKVKSNGNRAADIDRLRALRDAFPSLRLRWDPNSSYDPDWAVEHLRNLEPFELDYVEDPVPPAAMEAVIARSPVPVALDEGAIDDAAIAASAAPVVIIKPQRVGGSDRAAEMVAWCLDHGRAVTVTNSLETAVGRAHALAVASLSRSPAGLATDVFLARDVADFPTRPHMEPHGPGIGFEPELPELP